MKNYGVFFTVPMVAVFIVLGAIMIPIFLFGVGAVIRVFQFMWSPVSAGSIPIWAIFVVGLLVLLFMKKRRSAASY